MQNERVLIGVRPQRRRSRAGRMHHDLAGRFVHDHVVNFHTEVVERGYHGGEVGGVLCVVEGGAVEGRGEDVVDAVGGSVGHDGLQGPGVEPFDGLLGMERSVARDIVVVTAVPLESQRVLCQHVG